MEQSQEVGAEESRWTLALQDLLSAPHRNIVLPLMQVDFLQAVISVHSQIFQRIQQRNVRVRAGAEIQWMVLNISMQLSAVGHDFISRIVKGTLCVFLPLKMWVCYSGLQIRVGSCRGFDLEGCSDVQCWLVVKTHKCVYFTYSSSCRWRCPVIPGSELLWLQSFIPLASHAFYVQLFFLLYSCVGNVGVLFSLHSLSFYFFYIENCTEKSDFPSNKAENNWETLETLFSKSSHEQLLVFLTKEFYHPGTKGRGGGVLIMTYLLSNRRNVAKNGQILG